MALDESGEVIRPAKLWCDVESADEAKELSAAYGFQLVPGKLEPPPGMTAIQHAVWWCRDHSLRRELRAAAQASRRPSCCG